MLRRIAGFTAALGLAALALMPGAAMPGVAANASTTVQPDGGGTGWTLVQNQGGDGIFGTWDPDEFVGADCDTEGPVTNPSGVVDLTTTGTFGDCAQEVSPYTIGPTSADPDVWIEYKATLPSDTWAALWAVGVPVSLWPTPGEIDTAEVLQDGLECSHYHYGSQSDPQQLGAAAALGAPNCLPVDTGSQIYGVEWSADSLKFYFNGDNLDTFSSPDIGTAAEEVVLDNTTGGWEGDSGPSSTLVVQYVRVWVK